MSLGRSPLTETSMRRPSQDIFEPPRKTTAALVPPSPARRPSGEPPIRKSSAMSDYADASTSIGGMMGRPSQNDDVFIDDDIPPARSTPTQSTKKTGPALEPPSITRTLPSPSMPAPPSPDRKPQRRKSFHPAPVNTAFSREVLLASRTGLLPGAAGLTVDDDKDTTDEALLSNVEEMLEGFDWTPDIGQSQNVVNGDGRKKGSADAIESRLLDELAALDQVRGVSTPQWTRTNLAQANIHAFLESDDRIAQVLGHIDEALTELDDIDLQLTDYRVQLNAVSEDISYIESQNRGLQVQTSNQKALLDEMRQLLQIVEVPQEDLRTLNQESPQTSRGIQSLEMAAASLYKALQAGRDTGARGSTPASAAQLIIFLS